MESSDAVLVAQAAHHFSLAVTRAVAGEYADSAERYRMAMAAVRRIHDRPTRSRGLQLADAVDRQCLELFRARRAAAAARLRKPS